MYKRCTFYTSFLLIPLLENVATSRMYKKLHTPEKEPSAEPFCDKGSFLDCVPERDIMLTKDVYDIQAVIEKTTLCWKVVFLLHYAYFKY
jgi:hypothetical protein